MLKPLCKVNRAMIVCPKVLSCRPNHRDMIGSHTVDEIHKTDYEQCEKLEIKREESAQFTEKAGKNILKQDSEREPREEKHIV